MAPHPADWLAVDDLAILNGLSERARFLYHDVCDCDECVRLKDAARKLDDVTWWTDDDAAKAVVKAQQAVWEARKKLHKLHTADRLSVKKCGEHLPGLPRERMYIRSECEWDHELDRDDVVSEEYWPTEGDDGKFLVCDHCQAHALPCDENAVCEQCELGGTPCVCRWCGGRSAKYRGECHDSDCRYVHKDYLPADGLRFIKDEYIILPGELCASACNEKLTPLARPGDWTEDNNRAPRDDAKGVQNWAREGIECAVEDGRSTLEDWLFPCGEDCSTDSIDEEALAKTAR